MLDTKEIESQINEVLDMLRPNFLMHGGNITLQKFDQGKVYLRMHGNCSGCPASFYTLKMMIEETLKKEVPQVTEVIDCEEDE